MKQNLLLPVVTLALGGLGGYFVGHGGSSVSPGTDPVAIHESGSQTARSASDAANTKVKKASVATVEDVLRSPGQLNRIQALLDLYSGMSNEQLAEEAKKLEDIPMPERMLASYILFAKWAETDAPSALAFSNTMGFAGMFARPTILQSWASTDPAAAAKYYAEHPNEFAMMGMFGGGRGRGGPGMGDGATIIAGEWAKVDSDAAMNWAKSLASDIDKNNALKSIVDSLAKTDIEKAKKIAATLTGDAQAEANRTIAGQLAKKGWADAEAFIASLPVDQQDEARRESIQSLADINPQEALNQLSKLADGEEKDRATTRVLQTLANSNGKQAYDLALKSEAVSGNGWEFGRIVGSYVNQNPTGALTDIVALPLGDQRDSAIQAYAFNNKGSNYQQTFELANTVQDERGRERALSASYRVWNSIDPTAAKAAINNLTTITPEAKQNILEGRMGGRGPGGRGGRGPGG